MTEQDEVIQLSPEQRNPYLARPEHFQVSGPIQTNPTPGHGQRGLTKREEYKLLAKRKATGRGVSLPTEVDDAGAPRRF